MWRRCITIFCPALVIGAALLGASPAAAQLANNAPAWSLIAVQNANSSSSLQFTGANWSTQYNTLLLNCEGLFGSATGITLALEVGEGTPVSYETGAHYVSTNNAVNNATDIIAGNMLGMTTTGAPTYLQAYIDNPGSSSVIKNVALFVGGGNSTTGDGVNSTCCGYNNYAMGFYIVSGWWNADTAQLTGIELVPSSGSIKSGTCSLYGIQ
jgi:hypothetical protein